MNDRECVYDPDEQTMVFFTATQRHIRAAYSEGSVWYCATDIARLLGYRDPSKAINSLRCNVRILHVPHVSANRRGFTTCNCIAKDDVLTFISQQRAFPEVRSWIRDVVIPQAERRLLIGAIERQGTDDYPAPCETYERTSPIAEALDKIITEAVLLKRALQLK